MLRMIMILAVLLGGIGSWLALTESGQQVLLPRLLDRAIQPLPSDVPDRLDVFVCGASSPVRPPGSAQACVAVRAGSRVFLVDAGAGSAMVLQGSGWDLTQLEAVFLTHFHSDHIAAIPDMNLNTWVAGRMAPLQVIGPEGVERVVNGLNDAYALDRGYRTAHHGEAFLVPDLGVLRARRFDPGTMDLGDDLQVSSVTVNHDPIRPAVGYRFDYKGRSVVVSGDTIVSDALVELATGADLLLHDALSMPLITAMARRMGEVGRDRTQKVLLDVTDYHAHVDQLTDVVERTGVRQLVVYHLVPMPPNALLERVFRRGLPRDAVIAGDGMRFELALGRSGIRVRAP